MSRFVTGQYRPVFQSLRQNMPIGVAFVDERGEPGWIGRDPTLRIHRLSLRGCWPAIDARFGGGTQVSHA